MSKSTANALPADVAGLPVFEAEPAAVSQAEAKALKAEAQAVAEVAATKPVEKLPDPAITDYTFGQALADTGKYKLPNGTVVETN
jgi:hypothetical protein